MDIQLSGAEVTLIVALLASVTTPLTILFKMLISDKDRQIARLERQNEDLLNGLLSGTKAAESSAAVATQVLKQRTR